MKIQLTTALIALTTVMTLSTARANDATCMDNHEESAATQLSKLIVKSISAKLQKKGIYLDAANSHIELNPAQIDEGNNDVYGYFQLDVTEATLKSKDGTEFTVELQRATGYGNQLEDAKTIYLKPVRKSQGFDREGNAINSHCTLVKDNFYADDVADTVLVTNTHTGRELVRVDIPAKVVLY